jgi:hypothetical protein
MLSTHNNSISVTLYECKTWSLALRQQLSNPRTPMPFQAARVLCNTAGLPLYITNKQLSDKLIMLVFHFGSRCSSVSMSGYGLDDRAIEVRSSAKAKDFCSSLCVQTGSGAHPASCPIDTGGSFPGIKRGRGVALINRPILSRGHE